MTAKEHNSTPELRGILFLKHKFFSSLQFSTLTEALGCWIIGCQCSWEHFLSHLIPCNGIKCLMIKWHRNEEVQWQPIYRWVANSALCRGPNESDLLSLHLDFASQRLSLLSYIVSAVFGRRKKCCRGKNGYICAYVWSSQIAWKNCQKSWEKLLRDWTFLFHF